MINKKIVAALISIGIGLGSFGATASISSDCYIEWQACVDAGGSNWDCKMDVYLPCLDR